MKKYNKKLIANLKSKQLTLKQLGISMEDIIYLKDIGYNVKEQYDPRVKDYVYYIVSEGDMAYIKISDLPAKGEEVKLKLLETRYCYRMNIPIECCHFPSYFSLC